MFFFFNNQNNEDLSREVEILKEHNNALEEVQSRFEEVVGFWKAEAMEATQREAELRSLVKEQQDLLDRQAAVINQMLLERNAPLSTQN